MKITVPKLRALRFIGGFALGWALAHEAFSFDWSGLVAVSTALVCWIGLNWYQTRKW